MIEKLFGSLAVLCALIQYIPYIYGIIQGNIKPQRVAWLIWFALGGVIFFTQLAKGGGPSLWVTCLHMTGNLIVFSLAIKRGYGRFTKRDGFSLALAGMGLILWMLTKEPTVALLIAIAVDSIGAALVAIKAYQDPHSEALSTWLFSASAGLCATLAVGTVHKPILLVYPAYVTLNSLITASTILIRRSVVLLEEEQAERGVALEPAD